MTSGYATLAARGVYHAPQAFESVRGPNGGVIGELGAPGVQAIPQNTADLVTYALEGVVSHGTGTAAYFGRPAAGKTGTAENFVGCVVLRLRAAARGVRVGRVSEGGDPALQRGGLERGVRRLAARDDLEPLHVAGGEEGQLRASSRGNTKGASVARNDWA